MLGGASVFVGHGNEQYRQESRAMELRQGPDRVTAGRVTGGSAF